MSFSLSPGRLVAVLAAIVVLLGGLSAVFVAIAFFTDRDSLYGMVSFFDVSSEESLPTWFSAFLLLLCAAAAGSIARAARLDGLPARRNWQVLVVLFVSMSIDEIGTVHEELAAPVRDALGVSGYLEAAWVVPLALFTVVFAASQVRFLAGLPASTRRGLVAAGALYAGSALGFEMLESKVLVEDGIESGLLLVLSGIEEVLEMAGIVLAFATLLGYLRAVASRVEVVPT